MGKTKRTTTVDVSAARKIMPVDASVDPGAGGTASNGKYIAPLTGTNSVLSHLWTGLTVPGAGLSNPNGVITYGFLAQNHATGVVNNPHTGEGKGYTPFSDAQKAAAIQAIQLWDDLIPQHFQNIGDISTKQWAHNVATIQFANTTTGPAQAWGYYPGATHNGTRVSSDVWTATPSVNSSNGELGIGEYGWTTLIHEIGHTLGLSHPGNYNFSDDNDHDGVPDPITYAGDAQYYQDNQMYTIMSYFRSYEVINPDNAVVDWVHSGGFFYDQSPQGPMVHDIFAIQTAYGADPNTRSGDTTYGFHSNAGNVLYDFNSNTTPYYAIYDAGGANDTIDASGFQSSQYINLNPGAFSSIGDVLMSQHELGQAADDFFLANFGIHLTDYFGLPTDDVDDLGAISLLLLDQTKTANAAAILADTGVSGIATVNYDNFAIAYNTWIENAIGGQGNDLLVGNIHDNHLDGQGGDDTLTGDLGADTFIFHDDGSTDTITDFATGVDKIDLSNVAGATDGYVSYNATTHQVEIDVNHDGTADMFINSANTVNAGDYIFHA